MKGIICAPPGQIGLRELLKDGCWDDSQLSTYVPLNLSQPSPYFPPGLDRQTEYDNRLSYSFFSFSLYSKLDTHDILSMYVLVGKETEFCICIVVQHAW